ncbi:MAG TPA: ThiF family adenylyltransferase [Propionicimonas sp.]
MSLAALGEDIEYSKLRFGEGLLRLGFVERDGGWVGVIAHPSGPTEVRIDLRPAFPFRPPTATPTEPDGTPWSWHRELDGALCLVAEDDHQNLWWAEADAFISHVTAWFECSDAGWKEDRPDLDLDRYFTLSDDDHLYLYDELGDRVGQWVRFRAGRHNTMRLAGAGVPPKKPSKHFTDVFGYVVDVGSLVTPPRSWDDLLNNLADGPRLERKVRDGTLGLLVLRYDRGEHSGAILLRATPTKAGSIAVSRLNSAPDTKAARGARSGPAYAALAERSVAIIGLGALGSFVADMLVRAGVTHLTFIDDDVIKPGNLVRHLVGPEAVGMPKVTAVNDQLHRSHGSELQIEPRIESANPDSVLMLVREHDLVINATAEFAVTAMVRAAALAHAVHALSVAIQNDGDTFRIDVLPTLDGEAPLPESTVTHGRPGGQYFEAGCGSPISPTPPHAVIEAAAATTRHAVGLLTGTPQNPSGEVRHLTAAPDTI